MELYMAGLFFLVRDADGKAACTTQATTMIFTMVFTALFHYSLNHAHGLQWLPFTKIFKQADQINNRGKTWLDQDLERES
jgi:hypothetical protein